MKRACVFSAIILLILAAASCEPTEKTHARILGGTLRYVYSEWKTQGSPSSFEPTNYVRSVSSNYGSKYQVFVFTNTVSVKPNEFHCRFAMRAPDRFYKTGLVAITDEGLLLWIGDDGKIIVAPDVKNWSSN